MLFVEMQYISNSYTVVSYETMFWDILYINIQLYIFSIEGLRFILQDTDIRFAA